MLPDKKIKCPYTGQPVDKYGCNDSFQHMLMIENSQQQRQTGAAVESFRNEMLKLNGYVAPAGLPHAGAHRVIAN
jgi:hypothetical protein